MNVMLEILDSFSLSAFLQVTLNFELVVDILFHILFILLTSITLLILQEAPICHVCHGWFLFGVSYYVIIQFTS